MLNETADFSTRHSSAGFLRQAILNVLARGQSTAEALAAQLNVDLSRVRATLAALVATGRAVRVGLLFELPRAAA